MKLLCTLLLIAGHGAIAQTTIAEARKLKAGKIVTVSGRVTVSREFGDLSFIQDHTAGIAVYGVKQPAPHGDSVRVTGELKKYNGMLEIVTDTMYVLARGPGPVTPKDVPFPEDHEGELVRLTKVRLEPRGLFFYPQRAGMVITTRDTLEYWIDEGTDIPGYAIPAGTTSITGVVGRFGDRLQVLPRSHLDIPDSDAPERPSTNSNTRILTWNLEFFGASRDQYGSEFGPSNEPLQIENVAKLLNACLPDIIALQEVSDDEAFKELLKLMPGYGGRCSNRYSYSFDTSNDFPPQKLCFVYKTSAVKIVREKILLRKTFDEDPSDIFSGGRLPYLLEVDIMGFPLLLVNYHGKSGDDMSDYKRRELDSKILKDSLDVYYRKKHMVLLGDFNDDVDRSITRDLESPYSNFMSDSRYTCVTGSLSAAGWHSTIAYEDMIDHQVLSESLVEYYLEGSAGIVNPFDFIARYARTTSDHLPVMSQFDFSKVITGIEDEQPCIFPNPTDGDIWLSSGPADVTIVNANGVTVYKKRGAQSPISLRDCAPGLYTLILENQVLRLIKR